MGVLNIGTKMFVLVFVIRKKQFFKLSSCVANLKLEASDNNNNKNNSDGVGKF